MLRKRNDRLRLGHLSVLQMHSTRRRLDVLRVVCARHEKGVVGANLRDPTRPRDETNLPSWRAGGA